MSKINVTAKQLLELDAEIRRPADSIYDILVRKAIEPKLNQFYKKNGERIKSLHEKGAKIMSENFELNEDGSAVSEVIPAVDDKPESTQPKTKDGKSLEDANKAIWDFHNTIVAIEV